MDFSEEKTRERMGILFLCLILFVSGVILINSQSEPVRFKTTNQANEVKAAETATVGSEATPKTKININKASVEELDTLPGIGSVIAGRIVEYRNKNGGFKTLIELKEVSGIGDAKYDKVKDLISI